MGTTMAEIYKLIRLYEMQHDRLRDDPTLRFETEVALKLGYYVDWDSMVKH